VKLTWLTRFKESVIAILAMKTKFSTAANSKDVSLNKCNAGRQAELNREPETGNANIYGTMTDRIEIQGQIWGF